MSESNLLVCQDWTDFKQNLYRNRHVCSVFESNGYLILLSLTFCKSDYEQIHNTLNTIVSATKLHGYKSVALNKHPSDPKKEILEVYISDFNLPSCSCVWLFKILQLKSAVEITFPGVNIEFGSDCEKVIFKEEKTVSDKIVESIKSQCSKVNMNFF